MSQPPKSLPSQVLLGVVLRAFRASREGPARVTCVLRARTVRGGLAGRCRPRHWCCPLTALLCFLIDEGLVELGELPDAIPARFVLFLPLATEMLRWDLQARASKLPPQAHLRARLVDFTVRLGALIGTFAPAAIDSPLLADAPAWSDARRYSEPLDDLRKASGAPTFKELADRKIGNHAQTVSRWRAGRARPSKESIQELAQAAAALDDERDVIRRLRWHYSLSAVSAALAKSYGAEFVMDLAKVFCGTLRCTAARFRALASEPDMPRRALALWMGGTTLSPTLPWQAPLSNAERHGASPAWRQDLERVIEEYASLGLDESPQARFIDLIQHLPLAKRAPHDSRPTSSRRRALRRTAP